MKRLEIVLKKDLNTFKTIYNTINTFWDELVAEFSDDDDTKFFFTF